MEEKIGINSAVKAGSTPGFDCTGCTSECVIAMKVYGQCRQQDCLRPQFTTLGTANGNPGDNQGEYIPIDPSRSGETANITSIGSNPGTSVTILPGALLAFPTNAFDHVELVEGGFGVSNIKIVSVQQQSLFSSEGYWKVDVKYQFSYKIKFVDANGNVLPVQVGDTSKTEICAYSVYDKQIVLFGGVSGKDVLLTSNLFTNNGPYSYQNAPYAQVEAKATPLSIMSQPVTTTGPGNTSVTNVYVGVAIGLFTIIKLFRLVSTTMISKGVCDVPTCGGLTAGDPCTLFNEIPFPFDEFDPSASIPTPPTPSSNV